MKRLFHFSLICFIFLVFVGCSSSRVRTVNQTLYQSLPHNLQEKSVQGYGSKIRVLDGKIAKIKADLLEKDHQIRLAHSDVEQKRRELKIAKKYVRDLKGMGANDHEIRRAKEDIDPVKDQLKLAKKIHAYEKYTKVILEKEKVVFEKEKTVVLSQKEFDKIFSVHEYTDWNVPDAEYQVAQFKEQLKRFEVKKSQAEYDLASAELHSKKTKQKIRLLENSIEKDSQMASNSKKQKTFWKFFSWAK